MQQHKLKQRILSLLLVLVMILTMIPSAFAGTPDAGGHPPSGGTGDATSSGNQYNGSEEFIRFSVFFAEGADWSANGKVRQVGSSVDMYAPGCGPGYGEPQLFGDFSVDENKNTKSSARYYQVVKPGAIRMDVRGGYYSTAMGYADGPEMGSVILGETKEEYQKNKESGSPKRMAFPVFEGKHHNTGNDNSYIQTFLKQYDAYNQILFRAQQKMYGWDSANNDAPAGVPWQNVTNIEQGIYKDADGSIVNGQYVILCESGIYGKAMGYPVAMTMREAINVNERMGGVYFSKYVSTPIKNLCNGIYVEKDWPMLGLYGASHSETKITSLKATELIKAKFGAAVVEFPIGKSQQLPVINYFYDVKTGEIIQQALERKADNATSVPVAGNIYEAPMELNGYSLMSGFVTNKEVIKGNLDIKQNSLGFYDNAGTLKLTPEVVNMTGATDVNDIKKWDTSKELVTTVAENRKASKLAEPKHIVNTGKGLQVNYGEDTGNLQAVFLYVKNPEGTHVTKLYYDKDEPIPTNKKVEAIPMPSSNRTDYDEATSGGYVIEHEDPYKVTKWTFIEDKTPGVPENINTWEDAENLANGDSGDTTGKKTAGWTDPDKELVIRYEKPKEKEPEPLETDLRLTEKRISWLKSLEDIGGVPTIRFQYDEISGSETHTCGSEHCSGHSCNERIGRDSFLRFVSSNTTSVKPSIMGNTTNFMPYDVNNVHEFNRSNSGGTYDMHPNYGWKAQSL